MDSCKWRLKYKCSHSLILMEELSVFVAEPARYCSARNAPKHIRRDSKDDQCAPMTMRSCTTLCGVVHITKANLFSLLSPGSLWHAKPDCQIIGGQCRPYTWHRQHKLTPHVAHVQATLPQLEAQREADTMSCLIAFTEAACVSLARLQPSACTSTLPVTLHTLVPLLAAPSDGTRRAVADALTTIIRTCISQDMVWAACNDDDKDSATPGGLARAVVALAGVLQPGYNDAWPMALPVVTEMIQALGPDGGALAKHLLLPLADLCRCVQALDAAHPAGGRAHCTACPPCMYVSVAPLHVKLARCI
jgi:hypothetical protein